MTYVLLCRNECRTLGQGIVPIDQPRKLLLADVFSAYNSSLLSCMDLTGPPNIINRQCLLDTSYTLDISPKCCLRHGHHSCIKLYFC